jgi:hypothetical protein
MIGHAKTATLVCVIQFNIYNNGYWSRNDIINTLLVEIFWISFVDISEKINTSGG